MATIDDDELSDAPSIPSNLFIKAMSTAPSSHIIAKGTRNRDLRRPLVPSKPRRKIQPKAEALSQPILPTVTPPDDPPPSESIEADKEEAEAEGSQLSTQISTCRPISSLSSLGFIRPKISWMNEHCTVQRRGGKTFWYCKYCTKSYDRNGGNTAFATHLKKKHRIGPGQSSVAIKRDANGTSVDAAILRQAEAIQEFKQVDEAQRREDILGQGLNKATLEFLYMQWMITQNIGFLHVTHQTFRSFLEYINPIANRLLPSSATTITQHAFILLREGKQRLRHMLTSAIPDIHITCDMWSSPNNLGNLAIIAHFTSEKLHLETVTLALREIQGEHSGLNQADVVLEVLDDFYIRPKLGYFMMDNVSSNDRLVAHVADALTLDGVEYYALQRRLRCNGHIINSVVQAFLFGNDIADYESIDNLSPSEFDLDKWRRWGPLGKLHNICFWIMGSAQRIQSFKKRSKVMPRRDQGVRWNSWYQMIDRALTKIKTPIIQLLAEEPGLQSDHLSSDDWQTLTNIRDFLASFYDTTKATEGRHATLDKVLPSLEFMAVQFDLALEKYDDDLYMKSSLHAGYTKLLTYWNKTERAPVYVAAIVLDPTLKYNYLDMNWNPEWQPQIKEKVRLLWESTYKKSPAIPTLLPAPIPVQNSYLLWREQQRISAHGAGDELERYLSEPLLIPNNATALDWLLQAEQRSRLPNLSIMAIDIFSIPAMSSEPERVFSAAKHTINEQRMAIRATTLEVLECLESWFRIGLSTQEDLHIILAAEQEQMDQSEASD